jgi:hypothetical protein
MLNLGSIGIVSRNPVELDADIIICRMDVQGAKGERRMSIARINDGSTCAIPDDY